MENQNQQNNIVQSPNLFLKVEELLSSKPVILQLLRFGAIGVFNTAMDVLILNYMSSQFGVTRGSNLGWVNIPGFALAVVQSYYWNKYWAFGSLTVSLFKNFLRLVAVGFVGFAVYILVVIGAHLSAHPIFFLGLFGVFVISQVVLWYAFGFAKVMQQSTQKTYISFIVVSVVGFLINSTVLYFTTTHVLGTGNNAADNLNAGKIIATLASLVWNFIGYKLLVFRK